MAQVGLSSTPQVTELAAQLVAMGEAITDLSGPNADAAALLLGGVNPPRRSGQLAAAGRTDVSPNGFVLGYPIRYATYVHWGTRYMRAQPWLVQTRDREIPQLENLYAQHTIDAITANT